MIREATDTQESSDGALAVRTRHLAARFEVDAVVLLITLLAFFKFFLRKIVCARVMRNSDKVTSGLLGLPGRPFRLPK